MIEADGPNAYVCIDGPTLDATIGGKANNYAYGVYLLNDASLTFKSGTIKCAYGSCISTNNTTNGATNITILGGELLCDGSYAIYIPSQSTVNIRGGKVQGINARMGIFNIKGDAQIIPTTITDADYDDIGINFNTSGCIWFGDTIAVITGTYSDEDGTDCIFNISGDATVESDYRAAIGIFEADTKEEQKVVFNIANRNNIKTNADGYEDIEIYDHEYITARATSYGRTFTPVAQADVTVNVA